MHQGEPRGSEPGIGTIACLVVVAAAGFLSQGGLGGRVPFADDVFWLGLLVLACLLVHGLRASSSASHARLPRGKRRAH